MREPKLLSSHEVFTSKKFTVVEEKFQLPSGEVVDRAKLAHTGAAVIIPQLPDGRLVLIEQYRYALQGKILEFPAGTIDNKEPVEQTAHRELKEEIGGESSEWTYLGAAYSTPGFTDELLHTFFAKNVKLSDTALELGELVEPKYMTVEELEKAVKSGELKDMKSIVAFCQAQLAGIF